MVIIVSGQKSMVDGTLLQIHIQVQRLFQHMACEQMHCYAKVGVPGSTFLGTSLQLQQAFCEVCQHSRLL